MYVIWYTKVLDIFHNKKSPPIIYILPHENDIFRYRRSNKNPIFAPVKILALILSCYLLILGIVPCADKVDHHLQKEKIENIISSAHHTDVQHGRDVCSPFCTCSCCQVNVDVSADFSFISLITPSEKLLNVLQSIVIERPNSVWQPPKITC